MTTALPPTLDSEASASMSWMLDLEPQALATSQRIYLVRHGETDFNAEGIVQGSGIDSSLNATGRAQAEQLYRMYLGVPFAQLAVSRLQRTHQTLAPFVERRGYTLQPEQGFNEMAWGIFEGVRHEGEVEIAFRDTLERWARGEVHYAVQGGESPVAVADRTIATLSRLINQTPTGDLFICTHGRAIRILLCALLGYDLRHMQTFRHRNTAVNLLRRSGTQVVAERLNDLSHLTHPDRAR
jgi:broad specificity phosphatase PhoE